MKYDFELDMDSDNSLSMILRGIKENSCVLEFGPAMGRMTRYLKEKLSCRVVIVEIDEEGYHSAMEYAIDGFCGNAESLEWKEQFNSYQFDYVIFADVLEHLRNPQAVLAAAVTLLSDHGQIVMSVPNIAHNSIMIDLYNGKFNYRDVGLLDNTHIHFFTYDSLKEMIDISGLETIYETATFIECENTEFGNSLFNLPPEIRCAMKQRDYAYAYQFIFFCQKKLTDSHSGIACDKIDNMIKNHAEYLNVFIDSGEGYCEETKLCYAVKEGDNNICLSIEHPEEVCYIRIDFAEVPCFVRLNNFKIDGCEAEEKIFRTNCSWHEDKEYEFITIDPQMEAAVKHFEGNIEIDFYLEFLTLDRLESLSRRKKEKLISEENKAEILEKKTEQLEKQIEQMTQAHAYELQLVYQSSSWKITKPYRFMARTIKKVGRVIIPRHVRKGLYIILHEGLSMFFRRYKAFRHRKKAEKLFVKKIVAPRADVLAKQRRSAFDRDILFSIIVPLYNTPKEYLEEMIASCQQQTYRRWELCLADGSDAEHSYVGETVKKMMQRDSRIKYQVLEKNAGISENTNAALAMAQGDYIALLDHDDLLHPSALYEYMKVICEKNADFIYCDEMTFEGEIDHIITLHFKPDFAIDNLRANNYICHFSVFSRELLDKAGKFRKEFDGSQDHDMILRLTEKAKQIVHVPQILYYWRSHPASVASDINSKTYAIDAGKRAVLSHLERCGLHGTVESSRAFPTIFNIRYEITGAPLISILIPNKDNRDMLSRCIGSIMQKTTYTNYEILIIENNSTKQETFRYYDMIQKNSKIRVLNYDKKGFNYAAINNFAAKEARGEYLLFLNNDIEIITPEWIEEMLMFAMQADVGAVGAKLYYPDNTIQHAGIIIGLGKDRCAGGAHYRAEYDNFGYMGRLCYAQDFSAVTAACLMVSKAIFEEVGGFDEKFAVAYNDVDLCLAIRKKGYKNIWTPLAEAYHYESVSRGYDTDPERQGRFLSEVDRFKEKWGEIIEKGDPYYNVNLTLDFSDFSPRI